MFSLESVQQRICVHFNDSKLRFASRCAFRGLRIQGRTHINFHCRSCYKYNHQVSIWDKRPFKCAHREETLRKYIIIYRLCEKEQTSSGNKTSHNTRSLICSCQKLRHIIIWRARNCNRQQRADSRHKHTHNKLTTSSTLLPSYYVKVTQLGQDIVHLHWAKNRKKGEKCCIPLGHGDFNCYSFDD